MNKCIFLDRDGIINREQHYVYRIADFHFNNDIFAALKNFQKKKYLIIVITNQSGIAKNVYTHNDVEKLHQFMIGKFRENEIEITDVFYCPHHDEIGKCLCRKPNSLMIEKAIAKYNIDASESYLIGDKERDIIAAEKAGVKGILVQPDESIFKIAQEL